MSAFEEKKQIFSSVSKVLSFGIEKQNSKNISGITFKSREDTRKQQK